MDKTTNQIQTLLAELHKARQEAERLANSAKELRVKALEAYNFDQAKFEADQAQANAEDLYEQVKEMAHLMDLAGDELPEEVVLKNFTEVNLHDYQKAVMWCASHMTPALTLNKDVFNKAVKSGFVPEDIASTFVTRKAQVAKDLSKYA